MTEMPKEHLDQAKELSPTHSRTYERQPMRHTISRYFKQDGRLKFRGNRRMPNLTGTAD